ncbi:cutinase family protein [Streptomyces sp. NPDC060000]|uniref:cutinase family protein n=1 Tax=Streptomyces sp. NPDC060000 TaxID=3347031 RepID=UPI0036B7D3E4
MSVSSLALGRSAPVRIVLPSAARGTFEPGTLGLIVGDPVLSALQKKLTGRNLSRYAVNYPADLSLTSAAQGNADLVNHIRTQAAACPSQRFILVGYSQGANVVDNSIGISSAGAVVGSPIVATLPAAVEPRVAAVLLFGNPIRALGKSVTGTYQSRTIDFCATGDPICENGGDDVLAHLGYTSDATAAATFAAGRV